jgi:DedD protein
MATAETDPHLELKKRARRRLVGAVALALLAAIVLPMVMDQEPQPPNQDIQVRIPSRDSPFDGRVQPKTSPPAEQPPAAPAAAPAPAAAKSPADESPVEPAPQSKTRPPPATPADAVKPAQRERHTEPAPSKVAEAPAEKLAKSEKPSRDSKHEEARAKAILSGESEANEGEPAAARSGQFIVQLGVFRDPGNARKVQARVKSAGYNAVAEQLPSEAGTKMRVRAGPFASRELAEKAREKLKQQGLDGVVAPKS